MALSDITAASASVAAALAALQAAADSAGASAAKSSSTFDTLLGKIAGFGAFGGIGQLLVDPVTGQATADSGPLTIGDLIQKLTDTILAERKFQQDPNSMLRLGANPQQYEDTITKLVAAIQQYGGPDAANQFNRTAFENWLDQQLGTAAVPTTGSKATVTGTADGVIRGPKLPGSTTVDPLIEQQQEIADLTAAAAEFKAQVDGASAALTDATNQMTTLSQAATGSQDGAVSAITNKLTVAKSTLQYLQDKGRDTSVIASQTQAVADLQAQLTEAQKQQRIATYEFEHSDAYQAQQQAIARATADLAAKQQAYDDSEARLSALQQGLSDLQVAAQAATAAAVKAATDWATKIKDSGAIFGATIQTHVGTLKHSTDVLTTTSQTQVTSIMTAAATAAAQITEAAAAITKALGGSNFGTMRAKGVVP